jgi:hypothetical protein
MLVNPFVNGRNLVLHGLPEFDEGRAAAVLAPPGEPAELDVKAVSEFLRCEKRVLRVVALKLENGDHDLPPYVYVPTGLA